MSEGIDVNKTKESHRYIICNYYHFLRVNFRFQVNVCNGCHDMMQKALNFNDVAIVSVKGNDYTIHFWYINKDESITFLIIYCKKL